MGEVQRGSVFPPVACPSQGLALISNIPSVICKEFNLLLAYYIPSLLFDSSEAFSNDSASGISQWRIRNAIDIDDYTTDF